MFEDGNGLPFENWLQRGRGWPELSLLVLEGDLWRGPTLGVTEQRDPDLGKWVHNSFAILTLSHGEWRVELSLEGPGSCHCPHLG